MARKNTHKDVEFAVGDSYYDSFDEAAGAAVSRAASRGEDVFLDVLVSSKAGAKWFAGDDGIETYEDDPDASVFDRVVIKADSTGRIA